MVNKITREQRKGIIKMHSILVNMVQDHNIGDFVELRGNKFTLGQVSAVIKQYADKTTYTDDERNYLNEVRNLVLAYQDGSLQSSFDEDSFDEITWAM